MNNLDTILQSNLPTIMCPKYESLPYLERQRTRLIMAADGLYIQSHQIWGVLAKQLWKSPRILPYGKIKEADTFKDIIKNIVPKVLPQFINEIHKSFSDKKEWQGFIVLDNDRQYKYEPTEQNAVRTRLTYQTPKNHVVVDIHTHPGYEAFFSMDDNNDDSGGVKISVCIGSAPDGSLYSIQRYCVEGFFFPSSDWIL